MNEKTIVYSLILGIRHHSGHKNGSCTTVADNVHKRTVEVDFHFRNLNFIFGIPRRRGPSTCNGGQLSSFFINTDDGLMSYTKWKNLLYSQW